MNASDFCELDIFLMESCLKLDHRINVIQTDLNQGLISESKSLKDIGSSILKAFYAKNKATNKSIGKVPILDYVSYKKRINAYVSDFHKLMMSASKVKKNDDLLDYINREEYKLNEKYVDIASQTPEGILSVSILVMQ